MPCGSSWFDCQNSICFCNRARNSLVRTHNPPSTRSHSLVDDCFVASLLLVSIFACGSWRTIATNRPRLFRIRFLCQHHNQNNIVIFPKLLKKALDIKPFPLRLVSKNAIIPVEPIDIDVASGGSIFFPLTATTCGFSVDSPLIVWLTFYTSRCKRRLGDPKGLPYFLTSALCWGASNRNARCHRKRFLSSPY